MRHLVVLLGGALLLAAAAVGKRPQPKADHVRRIAAAPIVESKPAPQAGVPKMTANEEDDCRDPACTECLRPGR